MLPVEQNELISRVGPGTPMGEMLRRYWLPALLSRELEADGAPVRVKLLGEELLAFRDTDGSRPAGRVLPASQGLALVRTQ